MISVGITAWWSAFYGNHQIASVAIRFIHLAALLLSGGVGLTVDRQVLRAARAGTEERAAVLKILWGAHSVVIPWIVVLAVTGLLMTAADLQTFMSSRVFWIKMVLVALLVSNGAFLLVLENRMRRKGEEASWKPLVAGATFSAILWITTLFVGTLLTVAA